MRKHGKAICPPEQRRIEQLSLAARELENERERTIFSACRRLSFFVQAAAPLLKNAPLSVHLGQGRKEGRNREAEKPQKSGSCRFWMKAAPLSLDRAAFVGQREKLCLETRPQKRVSCRKPLKGHRGQAFNATSKKSPPSLNSTFIPPEPKSSRSGRGKKNADVGRC